MKSIVEGMGLDWSKQLRNINNDSSLTPVVTVLTTTGKDGKNYEMVRLPLDMISGGLFTINPKQYMNDWREEKIKLYRDKNFLNSDIGAGASVWIEQDWQPFRANCDLYDYS